jgi:UDP-N-acetylglucosamine--dolichyl-phosphate N-acetylglucosaminephosphotransferase
MNKKNFYSIYFLFLLFCFIIALNLSEYIFAFLFTACIAIIVWLTQKIFPFFIKRMEIRNLTGQDMNKLSKEKVAEMGGLIVLAAFITTMMLTLFLFTYSTLTQLQLNLHLLLAGILTITLIGLIGLFDDLIGWRNGIRQYQHALLPLLAALPLMAVRAGTTSMNLPLIGVIELGVIYSLILIPIGITGAANAFNMLAGLNGLEASQGIIILSTLALISFFELKIEALLIAIALIGALLAFIRFNWFPAKVFGGDLLTLMVGAGIAVISILGNIEKIGIALLALYFIELGFKAKHKFQSQCFGIPQKNGTLKADSKGGSLTQFIMKQKKLSLILTKKENFTEKQVVSIILGMQTAICLIGLILYFTGNIYL